MDGGTQETFDVCDGHPTPDFQYHYHRLPMSCIYVDGNQVNCVTFHIQKAILKSYIVRHLTLAGQYPPWLKLFSISCSFFVVENLAKSYVGVPRGSAPPPTGSPGSTPVWCLKKIYFGFFTCNILSVISDGTVHRSGTGRVSHLWTISSRPGPRCHKQWSGRVSWTTNGRILQIRVPGKRRRKLPLCDGMLQVMDFCIPYYQKYFNWIHLPKTYNFLFVIQRIEQRIKLLSKYGIFVMTFWKKNPPFKISVDVSDRLFGFAYETKPAYRCQEW